MKRSFRYLSSILAAYLIIIMISCSAQNKLIFFPKKLDQTYQFNNEFDPEEVFIKTPDSITLNGLFFSSNSNKVILYLHGNAGSIDTWQHVYKKFKALGYNFFIIDYRGYGKSTGKISEKGLYIDGLCALNYLKSRGFNDNDIILFGSSLGTGIAVEIASSNQIGSLILQSPYTSIKKLATEKYPYLFPSLYLDYDFNSINKINQVKSPILVIHGKQDELIPFDHGKQIYDAYKGVKMILPIEAGHHNNLTEFPEFSQGILLFLSQFK
jgi:fermentation-respiration switch protein FrsA (DUF1100 family)